MSLVEDIKLYLPKYLSTESKDILMAELNSFPNNLDKRMYTSGLEKSIVYQGDGIAKMPVVKLPDVEKLREENCLILSNTCDLDLSNERMVPSSILYAPMINLNKYEKVLRSTGITEERIENHISDLKRQKITQLFFLPENGNIPDSFVRLDNILFVGNDYLDRDTLEERRLFSLSNYGFYMLMFKLSVHFSRIRETVDRHLSLHP